MIDGHAMHWVHNSIVPVTELWFMAKAEQRSGRAEAQATQANKVIETCMHVGSHGKHSVDNARECRSTICPPSWSCVQCNGVVTLQ